MTAWQPDQPFNGLPLLPPGGVELETRAVLKACIGARAALAALDQAANLMPNPAMLVNTLPMLEAKDSSEIENIVTTTDRLFRHAGHGEHADPATKEALRYRGALYWGVASLRERPLSTSTAVEVCRQLKGVALDVRRTPGTQLASDRSGEVVYTPPQGEALLRGLLANWEGFRHNHTDIDPLVRMAAAHYQFEAIHPFVDGNGRTGRILNLLFLVQGGLLKLPILYLSRYIIRNKAAYYQGLRDVTSTNAWEPWLLFMLAGVEDTARWTTAKILAIRALADHTAAVVRERQPKIYSRELVDAIFEQPYCRIGNLVDKGVAQRQTAARYLRELAELGVLREHAEGREKLFVHERLLLLLASDTHEFTPYG